MVNKKPIGRPQKVNYQIISKLEDSLQYGSTISEACYYAGISRDTFTVTSVKIESLLKKWNLHEISC